MRIIAGTFRGRRLKVPKRDVRPTADRVKEAAFSILNAEIPGASVLDLFAGSGSLGLEALSRGASSVEFVEIARGAEKTLRENIETLSAGDSCDVIRGDAIRFVRGLAKHSYGIPFADPPYDSGFGVTLRDEFRETRFAKILCVEHRVGELDGADDVRDYGGTQLSFFRDE
jgi:16S rRNA (guanine966-N2)-methyltransferase